MRKNRKLSSFFPFSSSNSSTVPITGHQIPLMDFTAYSTVNHEPDVVISFNGRTFVCDMTELQARAILLFATREMGERKKVKGWDLELSSSLQSQIYGSPCLSMKRSLQRFLQRRRQRSRASISPYNQ